MDSIQTRGRFWAWITASGIVGALCGAGASAVTDLYAQDRLIALTEASQKRQDDRRMASEALLKDREKSAQSVEQITARIELLETTRALISTEVYVVEVDRRITELIALRSLMEAEARNEAQRITALKEAEARQREREAQEELARQANEQRERNAAAAAAAERAAIELAARREAERLAREAAAQRQRDMELDRMRARMIEDHLVRHGLF